MKYLLLFSILVLTACAHDPITEPDGPGGAILMVDTAGIYFTSQGHLLWLKEGVPTDLFTLTEKGWYMTNLEYHQGMSIRLKYFNP